MTKSIITGAESIQAVFDLKVGYTLDLADIEILKRVARMALTAMDSEQYQVVPDALPENDDEDGHDIDYLEPSEVYALGRTAGWNACRAAMLNQK